jgi:uncharacterized membrane protein (DUF485 family)
VKDLAHDASHRSPNQRLGMWLFIVYFLLYGGFIAVTVYDYKILAREAFAGINLAIVYGMVLIIAAIVLAILYACLAKNEHPEDHSPITNEITDTSEPGP